MPEVKGNYIKFLQGQIEVLTAQVSIASYMNDALLEYCESDKYRGPNPEDKQMNVNDVIHRAHLTRQALDGTLCASDYEEVLDTEQAAA